MVERDATLHRIERAAVVWCVVMALIALVWRRGSPDVALAVLGGGGLVALSYRTVAFSVSRLTAAWSERASARRSGGDGRPPLVLPVAVFVLRYALLGFLAYVMISRLRLHPIGLIVGASSVVAATAIEAVRAARA
jgi:hypothetical protein